MRPALALTLALLVLGGLGFFWLQANGARQGSAAPASERPSAAARGPQALAPAGPSRAREVGGPPAEVPVEEPHPSEDVSAEPAGLSGTIHGVVTDPGGRELDGVRVRVVDARGAAQDAEAGPERYVAQGLAAGHYWVSADARGRRTAHAEVELVAGGDEQLDFELAEVVRLDVLVLGADGRALKREPKPRVGALVAVARLNWLGEWDAELEGGAEGHLGVGRFRPSVARASEGGIGVLELDGEPPVWVHLCLGQKVLAARRVELDAREVLFVLEAKLAQELGTLVIRALAANGTPLPLSGVTVSSRNSTRIVSGRGQERVEVTELAPGNYTLNVTTQNHAFQTRDVVVRGGVQEIDVEVELAIRAQGRVLDAARAPLRVENPDDGDGPSVQLGRVAPGSTTVSWDERLLYLVDEEGRFSFSFAPGVYVLRARFEQSLSSPLRVDLSHGPVEGLELVLANSVELILRREQGEWRGARYELRDGEGLTASTGSFAGPEPLVLRATQGRYELLVELDGRRVHEATLVLEREPVTQRLAW